MFFAIWEQQNAYINNPEELKQLNYVLLPTTLVKNK